MMFIIDKTITKTVKEIDEVKNFILVPYWLAGRYCQFCKFDLCSSDQIVAFQYDLGKVGHGHNDCFHKSVKEATEQQDQVKEARG